MKKKKPSKININYVIQEVPSIRELFEEFLRKGFTTEQAYGLTITSMKFVLK